MRRKAATATLAIALCSTCHDLEITMSERHPNNYEQCLMGMVFGKSLPDNDQIYIDSTFGLGTGAWTIYEEGGRLRRHRLTRSWKIYMGPVGYPSCTAKTEMPGFGPVDSVFIHELARPIHDGAS
jgi:hypothetical protein